MLIKESISLGPDFGLLRPKLLLCGKHTPCRGGSPANVLNSDAARSSKGSARLRMAFRDKNLPDLSNRNQEFKSRLLLFLLLAAYCHNQCTRSLIVYAVNFSPVSVGKSFEFANVDLNISPAQYALLVSYGFTLLYAIASFFAGYVADNHNRIKILCLAIAVWSIALAAQGTVCASFHSILFCRVVQGFAMAFTGPQCLSLLSDYFPSSSLATALSIYTSGVYIGGALGSLSIVSNSRWGWRNSFVGWSIFGLGIAAIVSMIAKDPKNYDTRPRSFCLRNESVLCGIFESSVETANFLKGLLVEIMQSLALVTSKPTVRLLFFAIGFRFCAGYSIGCWSSPFFRAKFPAYQSIFSIVNALIVAGCGSTSALLGGLVSDQFSKVLKRPSSHMKMKLCIFGCLCAIPAWILSVRAERFWIAMFFLSMETFIAECWMGPTLSVLADEVPREVRGMSQAMVSVLTLVGNAAPLMVGVLESRFPLPGLLIAGVSASYSIAAAFFYLTLRSLQRSRPAAA